MNNPSKKVIAEFKSIAASLNVDGLTLNWNEKINYWVVHRYEFDKGNYTVAAILIDRKRK